MHMTAKEEVLNVKTDMQLLGKHNHENVMAVAMSIAHGRADGPDPEKAVKEFKAVEHRIEFVLERSESVTTTIPREPTGRGDPGHPRDAGSDTAHCRWL